MNDDSRYPCAQCNSIRSNPARAAASVAATNSDLITSSSPTVSSCGTWLTPSRYGSGDGPHTSQLPESSGSSIPSHISLVDPLRPECPSWSPILAVEAECTNETIRAHASSCSGAYIPAHPGVIRPAADTQT